LSTGDDSDTIHSEASGSAHEWRLGEGNDMTDTDRADRRWKNNRGGCGGGGMYLLGFIGAAVYFIQAADGFWSGVLGVLKALVWPAFLIYDALKFLSA
jgi:hypothetical protein